MRRRTVNNIKIAAIFGSAAFLFFTMRTVPKAYEGNAQKEVVHNINISYVDSMSLEEVSEDATRKGTFNLSRDWSGEDGDILMKIAMAEAGKEGIEGKKLVIMVVLNRMQSENFPNTIKEVVFQKGQFSPTRNGKLYYSSIPDDECKEALDQVMMGWDESGGALYFENVNAWGWIDRNCEYLFQEGNLKFFK